jgi:hypothetical protein
MLKYYTYGARKESKIQEWNKDDDLFICYCIFSADSGILYAD